MKSNAIVETKVVDAVLIQRKCKPAPAEWSDADRRVIRWKPDHSFYCHMGGTTRPPKDANMWCGVPFKLTVTYIPDQNES